MSHPKVETFKYKAGIASYIAKNFADELKQDNITPQELHIGTTRKSVTDLYNKYAAANPTIKKVKPAVKKVIKKVTDRSDLFKGQILQFQSSNDQKLEFKNMTEKEFNTIAQTLSERANWVTVIMFGKQGWTVTNDNKHRLSYLMEFEDGRELKGSDDEARTYLRQNKDIVIEQYPRGQKPSRPGGQFFPYLNPTKIDLTRYGIWEKVEKDNYKLNCLMYALKQSDKFTNTELKSLSGCITDRRIPQSKLPKVADLLQCQIKLYSHATNPVIFGKQYVKSVTLGLIADHYFILDKTNYTSYCIKNYEQVKNKDRFNEFIKPNERSKTRFIDSFAAIDLMLKNNLFTPITMSTEDIQDTQYYADCTQDVDSLDYDYHSIRKVIKEIEFNPDTFDINHTKYITDNLNIVEEFADSLEDWNALRLTQGKIDYVQLQHKSNLLPNINFYLKRKQPELIYFADFEATTDGEKHSPYMACVTSTINGKIIKKTFIGDTCALKLLDYIPNGAVVYFHNLSYDAQFILKHVIVRGIINSGTFVKNVRIQHQNKSIILRDSYAMISQKLSSFTETFKIDSKKEIMPYGLYTEENVQKNIVLFEKALLQIKTLDESMEFIELSKDYRIEIDGKVYFEHMRYAEFYCMADCDVLMKGFETFAKWIKVAFNISVYDFISLPGLSKKYLENEGCFDGCYELSGVPRFFIQKNVVGGRVMCADNLKQYFKGDIKRAIFMNDFDAVSLYPSAMCRKEFGFLRGKPKILESNQLNMDFLNSCDGYFIEITNIRVGKRLHFPLQSKVTDGGIRNFTNDFLPTDKIVIDKFALEDFQRFQLAKFDIIRGYYYNEGRNHTINEVMKKCFEERVKYQKLENPIETVFKLLMNASYGKTIQKEISTDKKFINGESRYKKFLNYNANYIKEIVKIADERYIFKVQKSINRHFNFAHIGSEILSMSKRIMNEVMCLAEDIDVKIYYQDTDSMHLVDSDIKRLANAFENMYGRKLIGKNIGQFHSDFKIGGTNKGFMQGKNVIAIESIFLGKKCYIDKLLCVSEKDIREITREGNHIRMKGVNGSAIKHYAKKKKISILDTYKQLARNEKIPFDMVECGAVKFTKNKDMTYSNVDKFTRELCFDKTPPLNI